MSRGAPSARAKELFLDAAELAGTERERFLDEACAGDDALRQRIVQLLAAHEHAGQALDGLDAPAALEAREPAGPPLAPVTPPRAIGPYTLREPLGEGGFGSVWLAEQSEPVKRRVALKLLKSGVGGGEIVTRFEAERQALALMDHPGIAKVFDGGATEEGVPWFAMEWVDGVPITEYCRSEGLGVRARVALFLQVCRAVQHAHQKGVIHRDLKPNNVLVARIDGAPQPKVIDFGIAKAAGAELTEKTLQTMGGQMIGTPAYMSPEQIDGSPDLDTRTDVYSLGVLLYELLSGELPDSGDTVGERGFAEYLRHLREVDPARPSTRLDAAGTTALRPRDLRGDLDWVVMRCLEKDRSRRYDSISALSRDLESYLRGGTVSAGPPDVIYRARKFARRHAAALMALGLIIGTLVGGILMTAAESRRTELQAQRTETELERYQAVASFLDRVLSSVDPRTAQGRDIELMKDVLDRAAREIDAFASEEAEEGQPPEVQATLRTIIGGAYLSLGLDAEAEAQFRHAFTIRTEVLGARDPDTLSSQHELAAALLRQRQLDEAQPLLEACLAGRQAVLGADDAATLSAHGDLATLFRLRGSLAEAETLQREILAAREAKFGPEHEDTVRSLNNLASVLEDQGKFDEAEPLYQSAVQRHLAARGDRHPDSLRALGNLGGVYLNQQRYDDAIPVLEQALDLKREILQPGHPSLLIALNNLAKVYELVERLDDAQGLYGEALVMAEEHLPEGDRSRLLLSYNVAGLLHRRDRLAEAHDAFADLVPAIATHLGEANSLYVTAVGALAEVLLDLDDAQAAEPHAEHAAELAQEVFRERPRNHGMVVIRHGVVLAALERGNARDRLEEGLDLLGSDGPKEWRDKAEAALASLDP